MLQRPAVAHCPLPVARPQSPVFFCLLLLLLVAHGCAPALPVGGSSTPTPLTRADVSLGGAARVPYGELSPSAADPSPAWTHLVSAGGVVPAASVRYGLTEAFDLGLGAVGSLATISARYGILLDEPRDEDGWLIFGLAPYGGAASTDGVSGGLRLGVQLPILLAIDFDSVYGAWVGMRAAIETISGEDDTDGSSLDAVGARAGLVGGLSIGFRRIHVVLELCADYESWRGNAQGVELVRSGISLTPAFALRIRL